MLPAPDCILHIGAGLGDELAAYQRLDDTRVVLVEPQPGLAAQLRHKTAQIPGFEVLECAVGEHQGPALLHVFNVPALSSLKQPSGLSALLPGLAQTAQLEVEVRTLQELIDSIGLEPGGEHWLFIDAPGAEAALVDAVTARAELPVFRQVFLRAGAQRLYEGGRPIAQLLDTLNAGGYSSLVAMDTADPDWPRAHLFFNKHKVGDWKLVALREADLRELQGRFAEATNRKASKQASGRPDAAEPIRLIHHFACTGGTLISKCIASMPNVQLLSEVAPYSQMMTSRSAPLFAPTDLIRVLRSSSRGPDQELEHEIFRLGIGAVHKASREKGQRLVIREHSHSKYCFGDSILPVESVRDILSPCAPTLSIISVRHPLDSFLSLNRLEWLHFVPSTLNEYANRYLAFLADHEDVQMVRYEDFVDEPESVMRQVCEILMLPFNEQFLLTFSALKLSGDSGRTSDLIARRAQRPVPEAVARQMNSPAYRQLCARLGYDPDKSH